MAHDTSPHLSPADVSSLRRQLAEAEKNLRLVEERKSQYVMLVNRWNDRFLREREETPRILTLADLEALLTPDFYRDFFLQADYYFSGVWDEAGPGARRLLGILAVQEDDTPLPRADLIQTAGLSPDIAEVAIEIALRHNLITEEPNGIRLAVPLMRRWIRLQQTT